ncbi:MAG: hypothetical protein EOQ48_33260 [Mesorhizobium sp.]|uniref:hypothetical protein n=1 Tax=Mesorhizobium sp. TaxID=1871066 RepID=UPI000FE54AAE|nr:MAG: hypothetical protein EOQ48_33260 [Mesorhizobium sp.]
MVDEVFLTPRIGMPQQQGQCGRKSGREIGCYRGMPRFISIPSAKKARREHHQREAARRSFCGPLTSRLHLYNTGWHSVKLSLQWRKFPPGDLDD